MDSCDMFVVLKTASDNGSVIFGKNSDRPKGEVQEVIYFPEADHDAGTKLQVQPQLFHLLLSSLVLAHERCSENYC